MIKEIFKIVGVVVLSFTVYGAIAAYIDDLDHFYKGIGVLVIFLGVPVALTWAAFRDL